MEEEIIHLTTRKKMAIWCLLIIIKIIEPTRYNSEWSKELEEFKELLNEKNYGELNR